MNAMDANGAKPVCLNLGPMSSNRRVSADVLPGCLPESDCNDATPVLFQRYCKSFYKLFMSNYRHSSESPTAKRPSVDDRRLSEERVAFMNELLDQWETMCEYHCPIGIPAFLPAVGEG